MSLTSQLFGGSSEGLNTVNFGVAKKTDLDIFAVAPQVKKESRREKRRRLESEATGTRKPVAEGSLLNNVLLVPKEEEEKHPVKRKHLRHAVDRNEEEDRRTVFVGNLPNDIDKKVLQKAFRDCGEIESIRIRNQVLEAETDKKRGRAVRILRGDIKKDAHLSAAAYILFKKASDVQSAFTKTGLVICNRHIFVSGVDDESKAFPPQTSAFLGNLSYETSEEDVWTFFAENGVADVRRVRIVRDKETGSGKGFGYVEFAKSESVSKAIAIRGNPLHGRDVRICHVTKDKKIAGKKANRRDQRKVLNTSATVSGPLGKGKKPTTRVLRPGEVKDDKPSWMGTTTNPRKKLARDLRPLVTDPGVKKKSFGKKSSAPPAKGTARPRTSAPK